MSEDRRNSSGDPENIENKGLPASPSPVKDSDKEEVCIEDEASKQPSLNDDINEPSDSKESSIESEDSEEQTPEADLQDVQKEPVEDDEGDDDVEEEDNEDKKSVGFDWEEGRIPEDLDPGEDEDSSDGGLKYFFGTGLIILAVTALRWFFASRVGLSDSEAYYYGWSENLSLSYYEHPPLIAYLIHLGVRLWGEDAFAIRNISILLFDGAIFLVYLIGSRILNSPAAGFWGALLFVISPLSFVYGFLAVPAVLLITFWLATLYFLFVAINDRSSLALIVSTAFCGLAILSDYSALLLIPLMFIVLVLSHDGRKLIWSKKILISVGLLIAALLPMIIWNFGNSWASFSYLAERHAAAGFASENLLEFAGYQLLYLASFVFPLLLIAAAWLMLSFVRGKLGRVSIVFWFVIPVMFATYTLAAWSKALETHWALLYCLPLFPVAGYLFTRWRNNRAVYWGMLVAVALTLLIDVGLLVHSTTDLLSSVIPEDSLAVDRSGQFRGWSETGDKVKALSQSHALSGFVASDQVAYCAQLAYQLKGRLPVNCLNRSTDAYDFFDLPSPLGKDGIIVMDAASNAESLYNCGKLEKLDTLEIHRTSSVIRTLDFYSCKKYQGLRPEGYKAPAQTKAAKKSAEPEKPVPEKIEEAPADIPPEKELPKKSLEVIEI